MPRDTKHNDYIRRLSAIHKSRRHAYFRYLTERMLDDLSSSDSEHSSGSSDTETSDISLDESLGHSDISMEPSSGASESSSEEDLTDLEYQWFQAQQRHFERAVEDILDTRVLDEGEPLPKQSQFPLLEEWKRMDHRNFRKRVRVSPRTFDSIVEILSESAHFYNNSNNPQLPIYMQITMFLFRMGHFGNASSPDDISQWAGVSVGMVIKATNRCLRALLDLHDRYVHLPDEEAKEETKDFVEEQTCPEWRNGFLMGDGTKFDLFERPGLHGDAWFDKNKEYSLDCQIISMPHNLRIVDYGLGHTGSVHDSWAFRSTRTYKEHDRIFGPHEFMWADSAYPSETWSVAPFKKPPGGELTADQRTFNYHVSKIRIRVEHTMGLLKGRWQSLRGLRIQISSQKKHQYAVIWARAAIILHNMVIAIEEGTNDEEWREELYVAGGARTSQDLLDESSDNEAPDSSNSDEDALDGATHPLTSGQRFRLRLMKKLFDSPHSGAVHRE